MKNTETDKLRIVFFGLGSIGKKHANIIKNLYNHELYAYRTGKGQEKTNTKIKEIHNVEEIPEIKPDIAFITNPTFLHIETALTCAKNNINMFIEKPISHSLENTEKLEQEIKKRKLFTYIGYNLRFHPVIQELKNITQKEQKPTYFRAICSSYLPNWRPNQDYTKTYSSKKEQGGGVTLDLSHEFDYINWLFNGITSITGYCDKISDLKIDTEDIVKADITCKNTKGYLHLDYFTQDSQRKIVINYDDKYIEGDLLQNTITIIDKNNKKTTKKYQCKPDETYKNQIQYFFEQYQNKNNKIMNNYSEALKTFKKIMKFKQDHCKI